MITGFNTDIKHGGTTYHVQTEDKGLDSPLILSLVYVGGAIIAAKRTPYEDLLAKGFDEKVLTERLQRQHKLICAAIKQGRVNELKKMNAPNGGAKAEADAAKEAAAPEPAPDAAAKASGQRKKKSEPSPSAEATPTVEAAPPPVETAPPPAEAARTPVQTPVEAPPPAEKAAPPVQTAAPPPAGPPAKPSRPPIKSPIEVSRVPPGRRNAGPAAGTTERTTTGAAEPDMVILTTLSDEVSALGDFLYKPKPDAPAAPTAEAPPADEPIPVEPIPVEPLEEDVAEAPRDISDGLDLHLLDDEGDFRAGQLATIKIYVGRGDYGQRPIFDASVTVKVLGSSFRPIILTTTTDMAGVAVVRALLPRFNSGRAAIIIRATVGEDSAELRRIIRQQ